MGGAHGLSERPDGLGPGLFGESPERAAILAHHTLGRLHLAGEFGVAGRQLDPALRLDDVEAVALPDPQPLEQLPREDHAEGVTEGAGCAAELPVDEGGRSQPCARCGGTGRPVTRQTVLLMLRPELLDSAGEGNYRFCAAPGCRVVYFSEEGQTFTTADLRVRVGVKEREDPIPLCCCFGFDESHVREEIEREGRTTIPERVSALVRQRLCACEARNPSGACCLGEVNKAAGRLIARRQPRPDLSVGGSDGRARQSS